MKINKKKIIGVFLGTIVEYYDYCLYGFSAGILATQFFPHMKKLDSLLCVFAIYSISYLSKPLGAIIFSRIGDLYGRKITLRITMLGIAIPTAMIGLLPSYHDIGIISSIILVVCRFLQGFLVSSEYDGAAIYIIEHLGKKYHYTASAITRFAGVTGLMLGIISTNFFNSSIFPEFCWRIPFLLSLPLAIIAIYYRKFLEETPEFIEHKKHKISYQNIFQFIQNRWKKLLIIIMFSGGFGATYQISIIFMKEYLVILIPSLNSIITTFSVITVLIFGISMPISGILADRFNAMTLIKHSLALILIACVLFIISIHYNLVNLTLISCILLSISIAPFNALAHGIIIKVFPVNERYRGISLGHTAGSMLMSGTANWICLLFMKNFAWNFFPILYIMFFALIAYKMIALLDNSNIE